MNVRHSPRVAFIRDALTHHLAGRDGTLIDRHPPLLPDLDLVLTPLELVLVAVDLEDREHVTIPVEGLTTVHTLGDLLAYARAVTAPAATALTRVA